MRCILGQADFELVLLEELEGSESLEVRLEGAEKVEEFDLDQFLKEFQGEELESIILVRSPYILKRTKYIFHFPPFCIQFQW